MTIMPRWSNPIYYNCDTAECTWSEWITTSGGWGDFNSLLEFSRTSYTRALLGLHHDPFMFHQANLRWGDVTSHTIGTQSGPMSLIVMFIETLAQEMMRLTTWPIISLKHDDIAAQFTNRMTRDGCAPNISWGLNADKTAINTVTLTATGNRCSVPIPVTFPVAASTSGSGVTNEQLGSDPLILWTTLSGSARTFTLTNNIPL